MDTQNKPRLGRKRLAALGIIFLTIVIGVFGLVSSNPPGTGEGTPMPSNNNSGSAGTGESNAANTGGDYSIKVNLSRGRPPVQTPSAVPTATTEPLTQEEIEAIFSRLPALPISPSEQTEFQYPVELLPPPRPGKTVTEQFPPEETAATVEPPASGRLEVLRYAPEGEIPIAPFVSVTFNQPMVPLGTLEDLAAEAVPVRIEPTLPGTWRWMGTKTLTFEYDSKLIDRLPKATAYTVTVPAGTTSTAGGVLAESVQWKFSTPPPKTVTTYPRDIPQPLQPLIFVEFDQRIDPQAVLETIQLFAGNKRSNMVLASQSEVEKDEQVSAYAKNAQEGRWLAFKPTEPFPADTSISVTIGPGTPSAEGPLVTATAQSFGFHTYPPLRVVDHGCSWGNNTCTPLEPFRINFNNPLDTHDFAEELLKVSPEIPGLVINAYGDTIGISGETKGQTTYTVTVSGQIKDIFGQSLGQDVKLTFKVGKAEPLLIRTDQIFVTLDPSVKKPVFSAYAINYSKLDVQINSVAPEDWPAFTQYMRNWQRTDVPVQTMPGKVVFDKTISLDFPADVLSEVNIDLSPYLKNGFGQFVVVIQPPEGMFESRDEKWQRFNQTIHAWVQVTHLGIDAYTDHSDMIVWSTDLRTGAPLAGVTIQPNNGSHPFSTGSNGTVRVPIPAGATFLVASKGADKAILLHYAYIWEDPGWQVGTTPDSLRWFVFDDRKMYRPGEEVHIKGWLRRIGAKQDGDVSLLGKAIDSVSYQLVDAQGNSIGNGQADVNALGGFDFALTIPQTVNLGPAYVSLNAQGDLCCGMQGLSYGHTFQIQEFRRPEFEVTARNETTGPYFAGDSATLAVEAKYYAGGPLPEADVNWEVRSTPSNYSPPNWPDFVFGEWQPWWWNYDRYWYPPDQGEATVETFTGKTDASGTDYLQLNFNQKGQAGKNPRPISVIAQATVIDVNRQAWASSTSLLVHPAELYIGLRSQKYFVPKNTPLRVDYIVTDLDGHPIPDQPVLIQAARLEWKLLDGEWTEVEVDIQECAQTSKSEPGSCSFETPIGGSYRITATITDEQGRKNQTRLTRWVSGGSQPPARNLEQEEVTLIPDKQTYQPGDTAQILVQSPFGPAEGLLTVSRSGFLYTTRFTMEDGSTTLTVPIKSEHIPNLNIQVDLTGSAPRTDDQGKTLTGMPARPAFATGQLSLSIPPVKRTLSLQVIPDAAKLEPGGETGLQVTLTDANDRPVAGAELAVVVVDEAILALTDYKMVDPISIFYSERASGVDSTYGRTSVLLANPQSLMSMVNNRDLQSKAYGGAMATQAPAMEAPAAIMESTANGYRDTSQQTPISVRSDFNPLAVFAPAVQTDSNGEAQVSIKLPDNLTRYRIMVVAVDDSGNQFGVGESNITARLPLMVRPSAPRFLNFGDKFELPVVLQNQTDEALNVSVVARATNLELATAGLQVNVPANNRIEVRFPASSLMAGTARIQVAAVAGRFADAAVVELPVYTPTTTEAFATYGVIDAGAISQKVLYPQNVFSQFGGLEINTASTALQALTDAVLYLVNYPFECSEQMASRVLAVAALRDVLTAFKADGLPTPAEMEAAVDRDIKQLQALQNSDGGFPYWRHGFDSIPFITIHAAHAMIRAGQKGFEVPAEMQQGVLTYLREIESHYPGWYSQQTRWTLSAYALYVRNLSGDRDAQKAQRLLREAGIENLSMQAIGWIWPVIDNENQLEEIRLFVNNHVVETAGAANFTTSYDDQTYLLLSSDRRTDGIMLDALIEDNPNSDIIPKVVNGLLAHRTKGRWENTQENVFVLLSLDRYFNTYEAETPEFVARLWLGDTYAGSSEFVGRTTERHETLIPMKYVLSATSTGEGTQDLIISKTGPGRLYYRLGLSYAPVDLTQKPLDMGFVVQRRYEAVDNPEDVTQDSEGIWHIKAGARVRVHITLVADNRRYHVALVDPLPAGLEIINPELSVSQNPPQQDPTTVSYGWWWWRTWYEHQNMRDDRAEAFTSLLWDGVYQYTYVVRATTPGTFIVPPTKAEEMYSPEVFGRSASDWVIVK